MLDPDPPVVRVADEVDGVGRDAERANDGALDRTDDAAVGVGDGEPLTTPAAAEPVVLSQRAMRSSAGSSGASSRQPSALRASGRPAA